MGNGRWVMGNRVACGVMLIGALLTHARPAAAQVGTSREAKVGLGHGLVGAGWFVATDDGAERTGYLLPPAPVRVPLVSGAVFLFRRLGAGFEALGLGTVEVTGGGACCWWSTQETEALVVVSGRWRAVHRREFAIDAVAGVGTLLQRRVTSTGLRPNPSLEREQTEHRRSRAFAVGIDAPISVVRHVTISPMGRVYLLRRGERHETGDVFMPSKRVAVGFVAGLTW